MLEELTKLKEITEALTQNGYLVDQTKEWEAALNAVPDLVMVVNVDYKIRFVNETFMKYFDKDDENVFIDTECFKWIENKEAVCECECHIDEPHTCRLGEYYVSQLDGWYDFSRSPIYSDTGRLIGYICVLRDINVEKKAKDDLMAREAMLDSIFRAAPAGIGVITRPGRDIIWVNDRLCDMFGYSKEELIGKSARIFYLDDEEYNRVGKEKYERIEAKGVGNIETKWITKKGEVLDIILSTTYLEDDKATFSVIDVTEEKKASERSKLNEDRMAALIEFAGQDFNTEEDLARYILEEAVRLTDSEIGYLHFVNEEEDIDLNLFIWSKDVYNKCETSPVKNYPLSSAGVWADCIRERKPVVHNDYPNLSKKRGLPEGHHPVLRHMSVPVEDSTGKIVAVAGVGNKKLPYDDGDVLQIRLFMNNMWQVILKKRAQEKLIRQEEHYKHLLDEAPAAIYEIDFRDLMFKSVNKYMVDLSGYSKAELLKMKATDFLTEESSLKFLDRINKANKGESISEDVLYEAVRKDGKVFNVTIHANFIYDDNKKIIGAHVVSSKISDKS